MKTKQELKDLYTESKHASNNFAETLQAHLSDTLGSLGFQLICISECVNIGTKRKPRQFTSTTVIIQRGSERFMTRRINALIDYSFSPKITESGLFDIIYNRA